MLGAGPVGLVVARNLASAGARVCVLESGPLERRDGVSASLDGEVTGAAYVPLATSRGGGLGGTANEWTSELARGERGARYAPLEPIDFEERDEVPNSGWPFQRSALQPYYERAAALCGAGPLFEATSAWEDPRQRLALAAEEDVETRIVHYGPQSVFTGEHRRWAEKTATATVYLRARALELEGDTDRVSSVLAASAPGRTFRVAARAVVLALGGIENARLLLLSRRSAPSGLGNQHDLVGRFFMDHPTARCSLELAGPASLRTLVLYDTFHRDGRLAQGTLGLSERALRRERLLNSGSIVAPTVERASRALQSVAALRAQLRTGRLTVDAVVRLRAAALGADAIAAAAYRRLVERVPALEPTTRLWPTTRLLNTLDIGHVSGWSRLPFAARRFTSFGLFQMIEQAPEPERRITLSASKDQFGQPLPRLHWFVSDRERASMRRTQELLGAALARAGIGRLVRTDELEAIGAGESPLFPSAHHHLGTTRMHVDPARGVVDEHGRVHGTANVFVAGTSVFPTGGCINPTLTAIALALRLAEHLCGCLHALPEPGDP